MKKRFISLLLAAMLLVGVMSVSAFAGEAAASGTMTLAAPTESVKVADTFDVVVEISADQVMLLDFVFDYPADAMELQSVVLADGVPGAFTVNNGDRYMWLGCWTSEGELDFDNLKFDLSGAFLTLTFKALKAADDAVITVSVDGGSYNETEYRINIDAKTATVDIEAAAEPEKPEIILGDANGDGFADSMDSALLLQYEVGMVDLDETAYLAGDVNGDGWPDSMDAALILQYEVGMDTGYDIDFPIA